MSPHSRVGLVELRIVARDKTHLKEKKKALYVLIFAAAHKDKHAEVVIRIKPTDRF